MGIAAVIITTIILIVGPITGHTVAQTTGPDTRCDVMDTMVAQLRGHGHGIAIVPTNIAHSGDLMAPSNLTKAGVASVDKSI
jgi:hypothetical protein